MIGVREPIPGVIYPPRERLEQYVAAGELARSTLVEALMASLRRHADGVALSSGQRDLRYAEVDELTDRFAGALIELGLQPLDRVLFQSANSQQLVLAVLGCLKAGLIPVCTLAAHRELEIEYLGCHTDARAHIVQGDDPKFDLPGFALKMKARIPTMRHVIALGGAAREQVLRFEDLVAAQDVRAARARVEAVPRDPFQVAIFQLSGGTTGVPKVIPRMQNDYLLNATRGIEVMGFGASDVLFMPMPIMHNAAMICFLLPALLSGATFCIPDDMTPEAWSAVFRARRPTFIGLIRALLPRLDAVVEQDARALERVRGAWAPDAARVIREKYGITSQPMFGMSEGLNMYCRRDDPEEARDWTVGRPLSPLDEVRLIEPGGEREVAVGEVGEFSCRGPYTLCGYYNAPERNAQAFTSEGFYRSGDLMIQKEIDGQLFYAFAGRTKDVVDRGSEKINCEEVENAVSTHPAVAGCAVVGMPDPVLGERVCAYLVLRGGATAPDVAGLGRHLEVLGMAKFKWPERIELIETLPLTKVGKLDKSGLREAIRAQVERERARAA